MAHLTVGHSVHLMGNQMEYLKVGHWEFEMAHLTVGHSVLGMVDLKGRKRENHWVYSRGYHLAT